MKRGNVRLTSVWVVLAAVILMVMRWWPRAPVPPPLQLPTPSVFESPRLTLPAVVRPLPLPDKAGADRKRTMRAQDGETLAVTLTAYCLTTPTRRDNAPREGIVAADPRVFALGRDIDLALDGRPLGRYRVDDTGLLIKGRIVDVWLSDCGKARRFGRRRGVAVLVPKDSTAPKRKQTLPQ